MYLSKTKILLANNLELPEYQKSFCENNFQNHREDVIERFLSCGISNYLFLQKNTHKVSCKYNRF